MNAFIIDGIRTPIGKFGGTLSTVRADDLAAHTIKALLARHSSLDPAAIDDVLLGCANQAGEDNRNVARMALLLAGLPHTVPGETVNRLCASGMAAAVHAARTLHVEDAALMIAGGVEHMTRGPWVISKASAPFGRDSQMHDTSFGWRFVNPRLEAIYGAEGMGSTAENLVDEHAISRADQDAFAAWSQQKAEAARNDGRLGEECAPVSIPRRKQDDLLFAQDEFIRPGTTADVLSKLRPAFRKEGGSVTAGNSSGLNDGACTLLMANQRGMDAWNLRPLAQVIGSAVVGVEPRIMGIGPVSATRKVLERTGLTLDQMDHIEINEAFAAQVLACTRSLGLKDDDPRINPQGGAIAIGHPLGMTGARLLLTAAKQLHRTGGRFALVTLCIGVGQGYATVLQNPNAG